MTKAEYITLVRKGSVVEVKEVRPSTELSPLDILNNIKGLQQAIDKAKTAISQYEAAIPKIKEEMATNEEMLKKFVKFEDWAKEVQVSKAKAIVDEIKDEVKAKVEGSYKHDPTLTDEQNRLQKFRLYQGQVSTHPKIAMNINSDVMKQVFYTEPILTNPWPEK